MASSGAGAEAQAQDTNLQAGFLGTTPGQAILKTARPEKCLGNVRGVEDSWGCPVLTGLPRAMEPMTAPTRCATHLLPL